MTIFFENLGPFGSQYGWSVALAPSPCLDLFGVCKRHSESGQPEGNLTCRISPHMIALEGSDKDRRLCASLHTCAVFLATEPRSRKQSGISILKQEMRPNLDPNVGAKNCVFLRNISGDNFGVVQFVNAHLVNSAKGRH